MKKVDGVENVRVSLKDGLTILDLKPGNSVTLAKLRTIIKNNGFVSQDAAVVARGRSVAANGKQTFEVSGTNESLMPLTEPRRKDDAFTFTVAK